MMKRVTLKSSRIFYVYEHWRPDEDVCFYVGKGHGSRAYNFKRNNRYYCFVLHKLTKLGMCAEVRMVQSGLTEDEAFTLECQRIAFWRSLDVPISNVRPSGGGSVAVSVKTRTKMSLGRLGMKFSESHRANLSAKKLGVPRKPFTNRTRSKMSIAAFRREEAKRAKFGNNVRRNSRIREPS